MEKSKIIMLSVIVILVLVLAWVLFISPSLQKNTLKSEETYYTEGYYAAISNLLTTLSSQGYIQIPISQNQSVVLAPVKAGGSR